MVVLSDKVAASFRLDGPMSNVEKHTLFGFDHCSLLIARVGLRKDNERCNNPIYTRNYMFGVVTVESEMLNEKRRPLFAYKVSMRCD
jgi:hypothetical protein